MLIEDKIREYDGANPSATGVVAAPPVGRLRGVDLPILSIGELQKGLDLGFSTAVLVLTG
jgi:hypothetical protein